MNLKATKTFSLKDIPGFTDKLLKKLKRLKIKEDFIFDIRLALEEALVNAVKHGNREDPRKKVRVEINVSADILCIEVEDQGSGFDYKHIASPLKARNLEKLSGRGVFLINHFMNAVEFSRGGRRIKMVKYLR